MRPRRKGSLRFIMSLRATGEGHISSIVFRSGVLDRHSYFFLTRPVTSWKRQICTWIQFTSATLPQLIETKDFITFNVLTLNGKAIKNKEMALFPRKIDGRYVILSRQDGENNQIMFSDNIHFWQKSQIIQAPEHPWEFIQIGNRGSPLETKEGWIVLTHGVGPMRQYCVGAVLQDLQNPTKIIARLDQGST
jgi:hypothetical protein